MTPELAVTASGRPGAPLLVLGPSLGTAARHLWGPVAERLAERFRILAWDLPGHGRSAPARRFTVADLAAGVLHAVDPEDRGPFRYAGVSLGGAVGLQLMLDAPGRITDATLLSVGPRIGEPAGWLDRAATVRRDGTGPVLAGTPQRWFAPQNRDRDAATALLTDLADSDTESYAAACDALAAFDVRARLAEIGQPVLAIAGAHDPVTPPASLRHIATGVQRGRLVVLPDAGHQSPVEAPDVVAALLAEAVPPSLDRTTGEIRAAGMRVRREVLGDAYVDAAGATASELTADFQDLLTHYAWGTIWTRPGLDRRSRSLITLTALIARGHHEELAAHLLGARRNGLTVEEIKELLLQTAIYCGVPDANTAFRIAQRVFTEGET